MMAGSWTITAYGADPKAAAPAGQPWPASPADVVTNISGVYPHLTFFNSDGECGIGAVVPWANKLWLITYPPHKPEGSNDKLYTIDSNLKLEIRPESVGGTHANRMIHEESNQLIIGPYFIDADGKVRVADIKQLRARLTATTRHLTDPANKVYFFGMERELYEVDVHTLAVNKIYGLFGGPFPGYHGKGAYVSAGKLIVANNGEQGWSLKKDPHFNGPAGALAESDGKDWKANWTILERKNFTEVTGPGGIRGQAPGDDRIWSLGWDKRSVLLKLYDRGQWSTYRLPKASYSHDAMHGWYTEWPRIRELQPGTLLMHMHGMFYNFPKTFSAENTGGLRPISDYLKMPVDYCYWNGRIVMTRDDASIMQNAIAGQSNSGLWFGQLSDLEKFGAPAGWGGLWINDTVKAGEHSEPFLVTGFQRGVLHLKQAGNEPLNVLIETDADGHGQWVKLATIKVPAQGYACYLWSDHFQAAWLRLTPDQDAADVTAYLHLGNPPVKAEPQLFQALADINGTGAVNDGVVKPADGDARQLILAANTYDSAANKVADNGFYQMDGALKLEVKDNAGRARILRDKYGVNKPGFTVDDASILVTEGQHRYRLPKGSAAYSREFGSGWPRSKREVVTERNLFNVGGTFYELPREDAGGFVRIRPVCTHNKRIADFCSWRGLLVLTGTRADAKPDGHYFGSDDGKAGVWFGDVDDLWRMGPPVGMGGPWKDSAVTANEPSDAYLMSGYDHKVLELSHDQKQPLTFTVQVDFLANGTWSDYAKFTVKVGEHFTHTFPAGYSAHWVRLVADHAAKATATFTYTAE